MFMVRVNAHFMFESFYYLIDTCLGLFTIYMKKVDQSGFEPETFCVQSKRDTPTPSALEALL
ncbi:hypothetical protein TOT_020000063 [Theileria orientalis strain Shintoku]|uniref:Uncharacterized protein n=1 Tax=Theileria orientalis strain Shintoku TaxID=869250 RepID=J4CCQ3_THEOR|nr:hypothetical protein TOT_020000063 [Theileria orientalis strain Shintoku]BAM39792.1 hypothetical protein TOT_020000063 [Theileria orientalis strain Shintoku]|eukprot:XP_009690093.1 hypothetical protein TOT_020000063 [Theileria orientalis strain Shintoku]